MASTWVCYMAERDDDADDNSTSIVLGQKPAAVKAVVIDRDQIIIPNKKSIKLCMDYKVGAGIKCVTLTLESPRAHGGFSRWDVLKHILAIYHAYGKQHDAVLDGIRYNSATDVYTLGCSS